MLASNGNGVKRTGRNRRQYPSIIHKRPKREIKVPDYWIPGQIGLIGQ